MLFLYLKFLPTLCWMGCSVMLLVMITFLSWYRPRSVPGIVVCLSTTGSLLRSWYHSSVSWMLARPYPLGGFDRCCVWVQIFFCRIWCWHSKGQPLFSLPLWELSSTHMTTCWRKGCLRWVEIWKISNESAVSCRCAVLAWPRFLYGVWWLIPVICIPLIVSLREGIFELTCLGSVCSKKLYTSTQIHQIWRLWLCHGGLRLSLLCQTDFSAPMMWVITPV